MRFAKVTFGLGLVLFGVGAAGAAGTWALVVSTVVMGIAALVAVIVMEERDLTAVEGLYPAASDGLGLEAADHAPEGSVARAA